MKATYIEKNDTGATLTTWIYCNMWQLYAAEQAGLHPCYINWPEGYNAQGNSSLIPLQDPQKFAQQPNMYEWYFVQPHPEVRGIVPERGRTYGWEQDCLGPQGESITGKYCLQQSMALLREFYGKNLIFNDDVNARGAAIRDKYGIDFAKTIGMTWRGTDSVTDGRARVAIEEYFPHFDEMIAEEPDLRILSTAEEQGVVDEVVARYGDRVITLPEFDSSPALPKHCTKDDYHKASFAAQHNPEWTSPKSGYERGMQSCLLVWLMSQCKHYVKNRSSVAFVASWLSRGYGRLVSIKHPEVA